MIEDAKSKFERAKNEITNRFKSLLKKDNISTKDFDKIISDISTIASMELAEYIAYRQQIILALESMNKNNEKKIFITFLCR